MLSLESSNIWTEAACFVQAEHEETPRPFWWSLEKHASLDFKHARLLTCRTSTADIPLEAVFARCYACAKRGAKYLQVWLQKNLTDVQQTGIKRTSCTEKSTIEMESRTTNKMCVNGQKNTCSTFMKTCFSSLLSEMHRHSIVCQMPNKMREWYKGCPLVDSWQFTIQNLKKKTKKEKGGGGRQSPTGHTFLICVHHKGLAINARAEP